MFSTIYNACECVFLKLKIESTSYYSAFSKVMESMIYFYFVRYLETNNLLNYKRYEFPKARSISDNEKIISFHLSLRLWIFTSLRHFIEYCISHYHLKSLLLVSISTLTNSYLTIFIIIYFRPSSLVIGRMRRHSYHVLCLAYKQSWL